MSRRTFIKLSGLAGAAVAASRILSYPALGSAVSSPELPEGEGVITEKWVPTSCLNCATRCAIRVRVVNGRAVKVAGNPLSQVSEGENCARAHVGLQVLYDPGRITTPLKRTNPAKGRGIDPGWAPISWDQALGDSNSYPLLLSTYQPLLNVENGSQNYPWAQEMFLVMHGMGWTNFVEMNSQTAHGG